MTTATLTSAPPKRATPQDWDLSDAERRLYARIHDDFGHMDHPSFHARGAEKKYFAEEDLERSVPAWTHYPEVPEDLARAGKKGARLKPAQEQFLFLRYNYARYRLGRLVRGQKRRPTAVRARQMVRWFRRVMRGRAALVRANMALVLAMAKRCRVPNVEFNELISEGNMALLRSVEKFDAARGFKFSTYGCRAILKGFNRLATKTGKYRERFPAEYDPEMERSDWDQKKHEIRRDNSLDALHEILAQNRAHLSDVEHKIVLERFSIGSESKRHTLAEVGKIVGLTNERVRQIQNRALDKLRQCLEEQYLVV